jgi:hypothetical protein
MKKVVKRKSAVEETGPQSVMRGLFRSFGKLAEQAAAGRPLLRGLRVAQDPKVDRFVAVHGATRVEFLLVHSADTEPPHAEIECRRIDSVGATEQNTIACFRFNDAGVVSQSTVPELAGERIDQDSGAWSIVAAVIWDAMQSPA